MGSSSGWVRRSGHRMKRNSVESDIVSRMQRSDESHSAVLHRVPLNSFEVLYADEIGEQEYPRVGTVNHEPFSMYSSHPCESTTRDSKFNTDHVSTYPLTAKTYQLFNAPRLHIPD
ncbi:hypothetical protein MRX96_014733 [Rhipicephalus microplus]